MMMYEGSEGAASLGSGADTTREHGAQHGFYVLGSSRICVDIFVIWL